MNPNTPRRPQEVKEDLDAIGHMLGYLKSGLGFIDESSDSAVKQGGMRVPAFRVDPKRVYQEAVQGLEKADQAAQLVKHVDPTTGRPVDEPPPMQQMPIEQVELPPSNVSNGQTAIEAEAAKLLSQQKQGQPTMPIPTDAQLFTAPHIPAPDDDGQVEMGFIRNGQVKQNAFENFEEFATIVLNKLAYVESTLNILKSDINIILNEQ